MTVTRRDMVTPSLFDEDTVELAPVTGDIGNSTDELDEWCDVPQARFLSWSSRMQLHYCWRRDLDAALRAETPTDATFFLERAAHYKQELDA